MDPSCSNFDSTISQVLHQITLFIHKNAHHVTPSSAKDTSVSSSSWAASCVTRELLKETCGWRVSWFHRIRNGWTRRILRTSSTFALLRWLAELWTHRNSRSFTKHGGSFDNSRMDLLLTVSNFCPVSTSCCIWNQTTKGFFLKELCPQTHAIGTLKPFTCRMIQWSHSEVLEVVV